MLAVAAEDRPFRRRLQPRARAPALRLDLLLQEGPARRARGERAAPGGRRVLHLEPLRGIRRDEPAGRGPAILDDGRAPVQVEVRVALGGTVRRDDLER